MYKTIKKNMKRKTSKKRGLKKRLTKKQVGGARSRPPTPQQKALAAKQRDANKALREKEKEKKKKEEGEIVREKIVPVSSYIPESKIVPVSSYIPGSKTVPSMKELINGPQSPSFLQRALGNKDKPSIFKSIPQFNLPGQVTNQASTLSAPGGSSLKPVKSIRQLNPMKQETKELLQGGEFSSLPPKLVSNPPPPKPESRPPSKLASSPSSKPASMIPSFFRPSNPKPKPETNPVELEDRSLGAIRARQEEMERRTQSAVVLERKTERKPIVPAAGGRSSSMSPLIGSTASSPLVASKPEIPQLVYLPPNYREEEKDRKNLIKQYSRKIFEDKPLNSQEIANLVRLLDTGALSGVENLNGYRGISRTGSDTVKSLKVIQGKVLKAARDYEKVYLKLKKKAEIQDKNSALQSSSRLQPTSVLKTRKNIGPNDEDYKEQLDQLKIFDTKLENGEKLSLDEQLELKEYYESPIFRKLIDGGSYPRLKEEAKFVQKESASLMKVQMTEDQKRQKIQDMINKGQTQSLFGPSLTPAQKALAIQVQQNMAAKKQMAADRKAYQLRLQKEHAEYDRRFQIRLKSSADQDRINQILANKSTRGTRAIKLPLTSKFTFPSSEGSMSEDSLVKPLRRLSRATTASGLQGEEYKDEDENEYEEEETTSQYSSDQIREAQEGAINGIQTAAGLAVLAATAITGIGVIGMVGGGKKSKKIRYHVKHGKKRHTKRGRK